MIKAKKVILCKKFHWKLLTNHKNWFFLVVLEWHFDANFGSFLKVLQENSNLIGFSTFTLLTWIKLQIYSVWTNQILLSTVSECLPLQILFSSNWNFDLMRVMKMANFLTLIYTVFDHNCYSSIFWLILDTYHSIFVSKLHSKLLKSRPKMKLFWNIRWFSEGGGIPIFWLSAEESSADI